MVVIFSFNILSFIVRVRARHEHVFFLVCHITVLTWFIAFIGGIVDPHNNKQTQIIYQVMHQMYRVASDWAWHGVLESYTSLIKCLVNLDDGLRDARRSEEHTSELQSLMRTSYAGF